MSERKIKVPKGMLTAAWQAVGAKMKECIEDGSGYTLAELHVARISVEAALRWLAENPIRPTWQQVQEMSPQSDSIGYMVEWQRRMFLAPESEVPDLSDVLESLIAYLYVGGPEMDDVKAKLEAYRRGKAAR